MSNFDILPPEMLGAIFSKADYNDRLNIDLTCKRFFAITNNYEDKLDHKYYQCLKLRIKSYKKGSGISKIVGVVHEKYCLENDENLVENVKTFRSEKQFFNSLKKIKLCEYGAYVLIEYYKHSQLMYDLRDVLQKSYKDIRLILTCIGPTQKKRPLHELTKNWSEAVNTLSVAVPLPFTQFAIDFEKKYFKLADNVNFAFISKSTHGNFHLLVWNEFIKENKFNKLSLKCNEIMNPFHLLVFSIMILDHIENRHLNSFTYNMAAEHYTRIEIDEFSKQMALLDYTSFLLVDDDEFLTTLIYIPSNREDSEDILNESLQITFEGNFKE